METKILDIAKDYAFRKHNMPSDSQRYGSLPYSVHLEHVVENAMKYMYYIEESKRDIIIISCYSHDLIEDTDVDYSDLVKKYGEEVADIVYRVSNERGKSRKDRNFLTYPKIWVNDLAIFVKLMDRLSNTKNSKNTGHKQFDVYKSEYPVFKYALKVRGLYEDVWEELDKLYEI